MHVEKRLRSHVACDWRFNLNPAHMPHATSNTTSWKKHIRLKRPSTVHQQGCWIRALLRYFCNVIVCSVNYTCICGYSSYTTWKIWPIRLIDLPLGWEQTLESWETVDDSRCLVEDKSVYICTCVLIFSTMPLSHSTVLCSNSRNCIELKLITSIDVAWNLS